MMNYKLVPTLKDRALAKVAVAIWNKDTLKSLAFRECLLNTNLKQAEIIAREKAATLLLPGPLSKELLNIINVISLELESWVQFHQRLGNFLGSDSPSTSKFEFRWTSYGTIDKKRTAEAIIEDENVDVLTRYKYACSYCVVSSIRNLWEKLDRSSRNAINRSVRAEVGEGQLADPFPAVSIHKDQALIFWTFIMDLGAYRPITDNNRAFNPNIDGETAYRYPFESAALWGNEISLKYLMQKLTPDERERLIVKAAKYVSVIANLRCLRLKRSFKMYHTSVLCVLLSSMNETQQIEVFTKHAREVLLCLLEWPWQEFFISTAKLVWEYLSPRNFQFILEELITPNFLSVYPDYNYQNIFKQFWELSPPAYKKFVLDGPICEMFKASLAVDQEESILVILRDATPEQRIRILHTSQNLCLTLIQGGKVNFLKLFLQQCVSPDEESSFTELNAKLVTFPSINMDDEEAKSCNFVKFVVDFINVSKRMVPEDEHPLKKLRKHN